MTSCSEFDENFSQKLNFAWNITALEYCTVWVIYLNFCDMKWYEDTMIIHYVFIICIQVFLYIFFFNIKLSVSNAWQLYSSVRIWLHHCPATPLKLLDIWAEIKMSCKKCWILSSLHVWWVLYSHFWPC